MLHRLTMCCVLLLVLPVMLHGQDSTSTASCTYDSCALRLQPGFWGTKIVRGTSGETAVRIGLFNSKLVTLVQSSDSAARYARQYSDQHATGVIIGIVGAAVSIASLFLWDGPFSDPDSNNDSEVTAGMVIGGVIGLTGGLIELNAQRSLHRSIWWYNRDLAR